MKRLRILHRGLSVLLSVVMILTMMPVTALAEEPRIITTGETTPGEPVIITTDGTMTGEEGTSAGETTSEEEESTSAGETTSEGESNSDEDTTSEEEESSSEDETTSKEAQSIVICGTTLEEGKAYIANTAEIGGIGQRREETDYFEYADGVLTIYGNVVLTQPADTADNVLKLEGDDLTINCPEGCSLTLDGQNSVPTVFLQNNRLTFNGTGDLFIKGSEKPVSEGMFMVANAKDVTIIGTNGAVLPKDSNITATGNVYIESTSNVVVDGLCVNNAQKVTLKGNTTDSVAMNVTFNNCGSWNIINENQDSTAPLAIQLTVDGITYDSYYGTELAEDETGTEADTVSVDGASGVVINATNFPDEVFRTYIKLYVDRDEDGVLSEDEIKNTTVLTIGKRFIISGISGNVADLTGLQYFTELTYLDCEGLQLTTLDISKNTKLTSLNCAGNKLTTLDISKHTLLTYLNCENNQLTALNLSQHTSLERLYCGGNQFTTLDLSNNSKLTLLNCTNSLLKTLDVSNHSQLITLDISDNTKLTTLNCSNCKLTGLDLSGATALEELNCANNYLADLDISSNTKLTTLDCHGNVLTILNLSNQKELTTLNCESNSLTSLDLSETKVTEPSTKDNTYAILLDEKRDFSLSELPEGFDVTKAGNWEGGKLDDENTILTVNEGVDTITYSYNCGNEVTVTFTLTVNDGSAGVIINATNFPDANFREYLKLIDEDGDNIFTKAEIESKVKLYLPSRDIKSLEGIEYFTNIEELQCDLNELTTLDLSKNTKLKHLNCYNNQLTTLDLSSCPALETLDCTFNKLTTLNITKCPALKSLDCYSNELTTIDLSTNTALETLKLGHNKLIKLNISKNTALKSLDCAGNELTALDVSKNTALESLDFAANNVTALDVSKNNALTSLDCGTNSLTKLDISKNTALQSLLCNGNQLKKLDVSKNTALTFLNCIATYLTALDVSKNTELKTLYCEANSLTVLDLSQNSKLTSLRCSNNNLTSLDLSNISGLKYLSCDNNYFKIIPDENRSFDLSTLPGKFDFSKTSKWQGGTVDEKTMILTLNEGSEIVTYDYDSGNGSTFKFTLREGGIDINATNFPDNTFRVRAAVNSDKDKNNILTASELAAVEELEIQGAGIESLKGIEYFTSLKILDCSRNELTTLDLSNNTALEEFYCTDNQLTTLDVSNCTALKKFYCYKNELTKLDVSDCTALQILNCRDNKLTKLDVGKNAKLSYLDCKNNKLSTINVTNCPELQSFYCIGNRLTKLDVSKNISLVTIECSENKLTKLDFSNNGKLQFIDCKDNKLTTLKLGTCSVLRGLLCSGNKLKTLDVSGCENLLALDCSNNNLTGLNVEPQIKLTELDCSNNKLTELNLINNGDLSYLDCSNNNLTFLKVSSCINELNCSNNKLTKLDFTDYGPTNLDCSNNVLSELKLDRAETQSLDCSNNKLQKLDLRLNDIDYLDCSNNDIFILNLDIYNSSDFTSVDCSNNKLNSLDFSYSTELSTLKCNNNGLTSLNISKCAALTSMECSYNELTSLDLSKCTKLTSLSCDNNNLTSLDLSKCVALETFSATGNVYTIIMDEYRNYELSSLPGTFDVTKASNFNGGTLNNEQTVLTVNDKPGTVTYNYDCGNSYSVTFTLKEMPDVALNSTNFPNRTFLAYVKIFDKDDNKKLSPAELMEATQIDVSGKNINNFKGIEHFFALESLNISGNTSIKELNLSKNYKLTDFDASGCTKLSSLTLQHHITSLNISNTNLNNFYFFLYQDLEVLDISGLQMPKILDMSNNRKLISFKASGCGIEEIYYLYYSSNLKILDVSNNHLVSLSLSRLYSLKSFNAEGNTRNIGTIYNGEYGIVEQLDLSESLILEVKGATLDREAGKLINIEGTTVTYVYNTSNTTLPGAQSVEFTLIFDRNMTVNYEVSIKKGSDGVYCETWEEVLAAMNDKSKDYYVYLHNDVEVDKFTFPSSAKAKSVTLLPKTEGDVKTITMKATSVSLPIDVSLENICIESTAENGFSIAANKNLSLNEFRSASLTFIKGGSKSALVYTGSEAKTITTDYRIEGFGNVELSGNIAFNNTIKANNLVLNDASIVYTGAYSVNFKTITAKNDTAIRYNTADFIPVTVDGTITADEPITIGVSKSVSGLKLSENQTVITGKNAELSLFVLDEDDIETGYTLGKEGNSIKVMKGAFSLSYNAGGTNNYIVFATWSDILNEIAYNAKLNKQTAKTIEYKIIVVNDANIGGALKMPKAGTFKSLMIKGKTGSDIKTLTFIGTTISVTGTTTIENLVLNSVKKNTDQSVDFSFSAGKNELFLDSVSGKIKDVKASGVVTLCDVTINGNVSAKELFVTSTLVNPTISKTSVTINKNLNVKGTLSIKGRGSLTVKGAFFTGGLVSTVSEDKISLVLCQNVKKPAVIGKGGFANSEPIRFALVDSEGNAVPLTDNMVIASINCVYTNTLIPCSENLNGTDFYIIKEKNKLVAKAKKDSDGKAVNFFEVKLNDKTAYYLSPDSAIKDINTIGKKTDEIEFLITKETFPETVAKLPLPKAGKYQTLTYKTADGSPTTIQIKGDIVLSGDLIIDSSVTIDKILEIKLVNMTTVIPMSINVGKYEFHAGKLSYDTTKSVSMVKNISGKGSCDVFEDMIVSGKITVKTLDITSTVTLTDDASLSSSIRTVGDNATLKYSLSTVNNVKLGNITNIIENRYPKLYVKIPGLQSGDKIATLTDDYFYVHIIVDDGTEWVAVRSDNNALVVVECDKRIEVNELNSGKVRVYDSYESVVADITRLKDAKAEYRLHVYQDKYEWNNILLPAKGKYRTIIISSSTTTVIEVKSDIKLTGNFAIGQNTTLRKVNADGNVADVLNFISPKDKQGKPVYTVTTDNSGKIVNGRLNGEPI